MAWIGDMRTDAVLQSLSFQNIFLFLSFIWLFLSFTFFNLLLIQVCEMTSNLTLQHPQERKELALTICQIYKKPYSQEQKSVKKRVTLSSRK